MEKRKALFNRLKQITSYLDLSNFSKLENLQITCFAKLQNDIPPEQIAKTIGISTQDVFNLADVFSESRRKKYHLSKKTERENKLFVKEAFNRYLQDLKRKK